MSDRVPVGIPRSVAPEASQESSITRQPVPIGQRADGIPVGGVPNEIGGENRLGPRTDHLLDAQQHRCCRCRASTSTKAGVRPARTSGAMSVEKVTAEVTTSSPG